MNKIKTRFFIGVCGFAILACLGISKSILSKKQQKMPALKKVNTIELPGTKGKRFDYLTVDYKHNYLFSAHLGADVLYVIDLKTNKLVTTITNTPGAEGVEYIPELNKVYTSNWKDHTVGVIDMNKMQVVKKIPVLSKPDGNVYASHFKKLYVSDEVGKTLFVIDVIKDEVIKKISFESETGMPQYDSISKKIYLNLQDQNLFVVIDPQKDDIVAKYPVGECKGNHGMALDAPNRLAFLICDKNDLLTVFDLKTFKPITTIKIPSGGDVVKYDPGLKRIYAACYNGFISVIHEDDPTHFTKLEDFPVQKKVHSLAVDLTTHKVYVPEEQVDGKPAASMSVYEAVK